MSVLKEFVGANSTSNGIPGLVPSVEAGKTNLFLSSDGTWKKIDISDELTEALSEKADKSDVYTKTETDTKIAEAAHLKRVIINADYDLDTVINQYGENCIFMISTESEGDDKYDEYLYIDGALEKVGSWKVNLDDYVKTEDIENTLSEYVKVEDIENTLSEYSKTEDIENTLSGYVKAEDGKRLITEEEGEKLNSIPSDAEKNIIADVSNDFTIDDNRTLILNEIAQSKISGLSQFVTDTASDIEELTSLLSSKVDKADDGSRLINPTEINQLANLKDLIQSVDGNNFTLDSEGKLSLNQLTIQSVADLQKALDEKVNAVENCRLITKEEADKLEALSIDDSGSVGISANVNASKVQELYNTVVNIVTGTGVGNYDNTEKTLLGIEAGAEKNYISSVDENNFNVNNGKLTLKAIGMDVITDLNAALNQKATKAEVETVADLLNAKIALYDQIHKNQSERIEEIEKQLIWKNIAED